MSTLCDHFFFFKQKTAYEMRISDWSSDVCSSDLPRDLDLGFYLFQGMQPRGLTPDLNDTLNVQLRNALQPTQDALLLLGMPAKQALEEVTALFAHTVGLLVLSHTGRIRMFKQASQDLFGIYLEQLDRKSTRLNSSH